jgi:hypothetical protein
MTTTNMNLNLPVPSTTVGPEWAEDLNDAFDLVDAHDHSSGKGVKVKPNGLNINDDLDIQEHTLENVEAVELVNLDATITGPTNARKVHATGGDLYFTNGSGTSIQITDGGAIVSTPSSAQLFETVAVSTNLTISASDTFVYLIVDTSAGRTLTLPAASAVTSGRIYFIKDALGQADTNSIVVTAAGSDTIDGAATFTIDIEYALFCFVSDGTSKWLIS